MVRRVVALASLGLLTTGCVSTEQNFTLACEVQQQAAVRVTSTLCDGVQRICGGKSYAHQKISIWTTIDTPAAVEVRFSDGTSERVVIQGVIGQQWEKPAGTGVEVIAQC